MPSTSTPIYVIVVGWVISGVVIFFISQNRAKKAEINNQINALHSHLDDILLLVDEYELDGIEVPVPISAKLAQIGRSATTIHNLSGEAVPHSKLMGLRQAISLDTPVGNRGLKIANCITSLRAHYKIRI